MSKNADVYVPGHVLIQFSDSVFLGDVLTSVNQHPQRETKPYNRVPTLDYNKDDIFDI